MKSIELGEGIIVTARGERYDFVSRCFYPKFGVDEDPVTGSAHCNFGQNDWEKLLCPVHSFHAGADWYNVNYVENASVLEERPDCIYLGKLWNSAAENVFLIIEPCIH